MRNFLVAVVLMSHSTVQEKMRILYDVYDNLDGVTQGNRPEVILQILQSIFERNLYLWPTHELHNQIEFIFTGSVGMVLSA